MLYHLVLHSFPTRRSSDLGGEEFTILFPNKNAVAVIDYLDLLRMNIESSTFRVRSGQERRKVSRPADRRTGPKRKTSDRKSTRLNSSHRCISYAVFCLKKK